VDVLKLDLGFLKESAATAAEAALSQLHLHMAHWLNLTVIAEGVETLQQADYLCSIGGNIIQGYLYARPMPAREFEELLKSGTTTRFHDETLLLSQIDAKELWDPDAQAASLFRHFLGAAGVFEALRGNRQRPSLQPEARRTDGGGFPRPERDRIRRSQADFSRSASGRSRAARSRGRDRAGIDRSHPLPNAGLKGGVAAVPAHQQIGSSASRHVFSLRLRILPTQPVKNVVIFPIFAFPARTRAL
jgi:hypothetical protein